MAQQMICFLNQISNCCGWVLDERVNSEHKLGKWNFFRGLSHLALPSKLVKRHTSIKHPQIQRSEISGLELK